MKIDEEKIIEVAYRHFREKGVRSTRLQQVAHASGVNHSDLSLAFPTKKELVLAVIRHILEKKTSLIFVNSSLPASALTELIHFFALENGNRATKTPPLAYLGKPLNESDLVRAMRTASANFKASGKTVSSRDHIFVKDERNNLTKLRYDDIVYIEANRAYCKIVTESRILLQTVSMNHVVDRIGHQDFVKVHRGAVINIKRITGIEGNVVVMGKYRIEMSKALRNDLISRLNIL